MHFVLTVKLIKRKIRHSRVLCWPDLHKSFTSSHIVEWKMWESSSQSMISSCRPVVFLFWGYPSPRAGMSPLFHLCWEHRREEGSGLLVPVNSQLVMLIFIFPYCSVNTQNDSEDDPQSCCLEVIRQPYCEKIKCMSVIPLFSPCSCWPNCSERAACTCP